jgi:hypothetical protein
MIVAFKLNRVKRKKIKDGTLNINSLSGIAEMQDGLIYISIKIESISSAASRFLLSQERQDEK